jgi:hypothetical protein
MAFIVHLPLTSITWISPDEFPGCDGYHVPA